MAEPFAPRTGLEIAVVGMAGRFPGADSVDAFWRNLRDGIVSVSRFTPEELAESGVRSEDAADPAYVPARGVVDGADRFDASFFGYFPRDAELIDPQQRLFLECAWEAMESAGYDPAAYSGAAGVFAGSGTNAYGALLAADPEIAATADAMQLLFATGKDFIATRTAHKLGLRGPAVAVQTACSTSLVAVHAACQSLLAGECSLALAGGATVAVPQRVGHRHVAGGVLSADGACRAFDSAAGGTVSGDAVGVVALRRLDDALADGDPIRAVILGSAVNNDGGRGAAFTAPSVEGQAEVIRLAHAAAEIDPGTLGFVEAHGTGTALGDPVEVAALTRAFRAGTAREGFCALGSVKPNIGHTDAAAGVCGLIKAVLALEHGEIPPTPHFTAPNPEIPFTGSPFFVATDLRPWPRGDAPRRAGVSSFGIGGTNAHLVLEEAPPRERARPVARGWELLVLSARTPAARDAASRRLAAHLRARPETDLASAAWTLQAGRRAFGHRRTLVCRDRAEAAALLEGGAPERVHDARAGDGPEPVVFLFPGGGAQYVGMGRGLYDGEPAFRAEVDRCAALLRPHLGLDLRHVLFPSPEEESRAAERLQGTALGLPALFVVEYALATLWMTWGVRPAAMLGHSLGEYVAATLAGVFDLEDALALVALRGRLMEGLPAGAMLSVALSAAEVLSLLGDALSLAAVNGPELCVVSGPVGEVDALERRLAEGGVDRRRLHIATAGHSSLVEPILGDLERFVATLRLREPRIPYVSNVTGTWARPGEVTDPAYWARHLRATVRFADAVQAVLAGGRGVFLEVGPGLTLSSLVRRHPAGARSVALPSLRHPQDDQPDVPFVLRTLGRLWTHGVEVDWAALHGGPRPRTPLPAYPFERVRHWPRAVLPLALVPAVDDIDGADRADSIPIDVPLATPAADAVAAEGPEGRILAVWRRMFGTEEVGPHDDFFDLGGHSLMATRMVFELRRELGVDLTLRDLFRSPTPAALAGAVAAGAHAASSPSGAADPASADPAHPINPSGAASTGAAPIRRFGSAVARVGDDEARAMEGDVWLDADIVPERAGTPAPVPASVLLTGATGYLGAYLLRELLEQTAATVHCLVRADGADEGMRRIRQTLVGYGLWNDALGARIAAVPGDLGCPLLGLAEDAFRALAGDVDAVVHAGAVVHFTQPYARLRVANVDGTREVLRLAARGRPKAVHHVSTLAVFPPAADGRAWPEDALPDAPRGLATGYAESKWVAERVAALGRARGLSVTVHRPGAVFGDARTGICRPEDAVWRMVAGCIQLGMAPADRGGELAGATTDRVSRALVRLSLLPAARGGAFHLCAPRPLRWAQVFRRVRAAGYPLHPVPLAAWMAAVAEHAERGETALAPLAHLLDGSGGPTPRFDTARTLAALSPEAEAEPAGALPGAAFRRFLAHLARSGAVHPPPSRVGRPPPEITGG